MGGLFRYVTFIFERIHSWLPRGTAGTDRCGRVEPAGQSRAFPLGFGSINQRFTKNWNAWGLSRFLWFIWVSLRSFRTSFTKHYVCSKEHLHTVKASFINPYRLTLLAPSTKRLKGSQAVFPNDLRLESAHKHHHHLFVTCVQKKPQRRYLPAKTLSCVNKSQILRLYITRGFFFLVVGHS